MHNRARLVVGSFLTKDLHLDWREGERWFERLLLDGEPRAEQRQLAVDRLDRRRSRAVLPADLQPVLQQQQVRPRAATTCAAGCPSWRDVPDAKLTEPWTMSEDEQHAAGCVIGRDYPAPIVDHAAERRGGACERYAEAAASFRARDACRL